ncbi:hypothetical protein HYH03_003155 [Edaphochlamys debaryana]|uniref:Uncharacterized protein n=1 Tax=Edaphochlamys debaryana TaxID=47281 RepID=A0A835YCD8_9CHLO|nr:hypothetical protein HYH03_003155 [Edaphochlamys debaryana]|eukprot:KAG2498967.1 hypothetical protein HYH03_003155 [Edaphochlamys debaryana]
MHVPLLLVLSLCALAATGHGASLPHLASNGASRSRITCRLAGFDFTILGRLVAERQGVVEVHNVRVARAGDPGQDLELLGLAVVQDGYSEEPTTQLAAQLCGDLAGATSSQVLRLLGGVLQGSRPAQPAPVPVVSIPAAGAWSLVLVNCAGAAAPSLSLTLDLPAGVEWLTEPAAAAGVGALCRREPAPLPEDPSGASTPTPSAAIRRLTEAAEGKLTTRAKLTRDSRALVRLVPAAVEFPAAGGSVEVSVSGLSYGGSVQALWDWEANFGLLLSSADPQVEDLLQTQVAAFAARAPSVWCLLNSMDPLVRFHDANVQAVRQGSITSYTFRFPVPAAGAYNLYFVSCVHDAWVSVTLGMAFLGVMSGQRWPPQPAAPDADTPPSPPSPPRQPFAPWQPFLLSPPAPPVGPSVNITTRATLSQDSRSLVRLHGAVSFGMRGAVHYTVSNVTLDGTPANGSVVLDNFGFLLSLANPTTDSLLQKQAAAWAARKPGVRCPLTPYGDIFTFGSAREQADVYNGPDSYTITRLITSNRPDETAYLYFASCERDMRVSFTLDVALENVVLGDGWPSLAPPDASTTPPPPPSPSPPPALQDVSIRFSLLQDTRPLVRISDAVSFNTSANDGAGSTLSVTVTAAGLTPAPGAELSSWIDVGLFLFPVNSAQNSAMQKQQADWAAGKPGADCVLWTYSNLFTFADSSVKAIMRNALSSFTFRFVVMQTASFYLYFASCERGAAVDLTVTVNFTQVTLGSGALRSPPTAGATGSPPTSPPPHLPPPPPPLLPASPPGLVLGGPPPPFANTSLTVRLDNDSRLLVPLALPFLTAPWPEDWSQGSGGGISLALSRVRLQLPAGVSTKDALSRLGILIWPGTAAAISELVQQAEALVALDSCILWDSGSLLDFSDSSVAAVISGKQDVARGSWPVQVSGGYVLVFVNCLPGAAVSFELSLQLAHVRYPWRDPNVGLQPAPPERVRGQPPAPGSPQPSPGPESPSPGTSPSPDLSPSPDSSPEEGAGPPRSDSAAQPPTAEGRRSPPQRRRQPPPRRAGRPPPPRRRGAPFLKWRGLG